MLEENEPLCGGAWGRSAPGGGARGGGLTVEVQYRRSRTLLGQLCDLDHDESKPTSDMS
jgi:hypothetical protein